MKPSERGRIAADFQKPSTEYRLLLGNVKVIGIGSDFDDQDGRFPRIARLSPNYETIMKYQFIGRFERAMTKSQAKVVFLLLKNMPSFQEKSRCGSKSKRIIDRLFFLISNYHLTVRIDDHTIV